MSKNLINIYNNFIKLTTNKKLYFYLDKQDDFSDRLKILLLHMAFFFKVSKKNEEKPKLQEIYDFIFRQLELSIREIGYGDQSINKKMKDYINIFHSMVSELHYWEKLTKSEKIEKFSIFLEGLSNIEHLLEYFENFNQNLSKKTLNSYLKSVINP